MYDHIEKSGLSLGAVVAVDLSKKYLVTKFRKQFRCSAGHSHKLIESDKDHPICTECGANLARAFDLTNPTLISTIERYFKVEGVNFLSQNC